MANAKVMIPESGSELDELDRVWRGVLGLRASSEDTSPCCTELGPLPCPTETSAQMRRMFPGPILSLCGVAQD